MFTDNDYSHTLLEQEEQHFYSCVMDVVEAFQTHGAMNILKEVMKNPPELKDSIFMYQVNQL